MSLSPLLAFYAGVNAAKCSQQIRQILDAKEDEDDHQTAGDICNQKEFSGTSLHTPSLDGSQPQRNNALANFILSFISNRTDYGLLFN